MTLTQGHQIRRLQAGDSGQRKKQNVDAPPIRLRLPNRRVRRGRQQFLLLGPNSRAHVAPIDKIAMSWSQSPRSKPAQFVILKDIAGKLLPLNESSGTLGKPTGLPSAKQHSGS